MPELRMPRWEVVLCVGNALYRFEADTRSGSVDLLYGYLRRQDGVLRAEIEIRPVAGDPAVFATESSPTCGQ